MQISQATRMYKFQNQNKTNTGGFFSFIHSPSLSNNKAYSPHGKTKCKKEVIWDCCRISGNSLILQVLNQSLEKTKCQDFQQALKQTINRPGFPRKEEEPEALTFLVFHAVVNSQLLLQWYRLNRWFSSELRAALCFLFQRLTPSLHRGEKNWIISLQESQPETIPTVLLRAADGLLRYLLPSTLLFFP